MTQEENRFPEEETQDNPQEKVKTPWQLQKESWYDKIPLNLKQLDTIIAVCWILLALTAVLIYLDARDIFHLFG